LGLHRQTTQRYAHLFDDPLGVGLQRVDELLRPKLKLIEISPPDAGPSAPTSERLIKSLDSPAA
jgi:hypothetical protein